MRKMERHVGEVEKLFEQYLEDSESANFKACLENTISSSASFRRAIHNSGLLEPFRESQAAANTRLWHASIALLGLISLAFQVAAIVHVAV